MPVHTSVRTYDADDPRADRPLSRDEWAARVEQDQRARERREREEGEKK